MISRAASIEARAFGRLPRSRSTTALLLSVVASPARSPTARRINLPSILPTSVGNAQTVCPPHIEGWHRRWKVFSAVHGDQQVAGFDTRSVCWTGFKDVQEKPALSAGLQKAAKSGVNRMLGKNLFP